MAQCFVDYCNSCMTYMTKVCAEWVQDHWDQFEPNTRDVITRHTEWEVRRGRCGAEMDKETWLALLAWIGDQE